MSSVVGASCVVVVGSCLRGTRNEEHKHYSAAALLAHMLVHTTNKKRCRNNSPLSGNNFLENCVGTYVCTDDVVVLIFLVWQKLVLLEVAGGGLHGTTRCSA